MPKWTLAEALGAKDLNGSWVGWSCQGEALCRLGSWQSLQSTNNINPHRRERYLGKRGESGGEPNQKHAKKTGFSQLFQRPRIAIIYSSLHPIETSTDELRVSSQSTRAYHNLKCLGWSPILSKSSDSSWPNTECPSKLLLYMDTWSWKSETIINQCQFPAKSTQTNIRFAPKSAMDLKPMSSRMLSPFFSGSLKNHTSALQLHQLQLSSTSPLDLVHLIGQLAWEVQARQLAWSSICDLLTIHPTKPRPVVPVSFRLIHSTKRWFFTPSAGEMTLRKPHGWKNITGRIWVLVFHFSSQEQDVPLHLTYIILQVYCMP